MIRINFHNRKSLNQLVVSVLILITVFTSVFGTELYVPSLPAITNALHTTEGLVQLTITVYLLAMVVSSLFYGPLSDRYGRRITVIVGLFINVIGCLIASMAHSIEWLLLGRFIQGAGLGAPMCLGRSMVCDVFTGNELAKVASYFGFIVSLAVAFSPVFGGYLQTWFNWHANFIFMSIYGILIITLMFLLLPETQRQRQSLLSIKKIIQDYRSLLTNRIFIATIVCTNVAIAGLMVYYAIGPFILQTSLGLTPVEYGWLAILITAAMIIGRILNTILIHRVSADKLLGAGVLLMWIGGMSMLAFGIWFKLDIWLILLPMLIFVVASGFIYGNSMAIAFQSVEDDKVGVAGALYGSLQLLGAFAATVLVAYLHAASQWPLAWILTLLGMTGMLAYWCTKK